MSVVELARKLSSGAITKEEILESRMKAISKHNDELNAFLTILKGPRAKRNPRRGQLAGITIALKDNIYLKGHRATAGSRILARFVPSYDADIVTRLGEAGATMLGKTNMHEFAFGVTNINPHFGDCRNPWNQDRVSGGSSGGSAVAVAAGMACAAVGTDTAGSVRIPASLCGVVGYKPTTGLISTRGIIPLAWSLDTVGFLTRQVEDAVLLASIAFGERELQPRLRPLSLVGLRIGVPQNLLDSAEDAVRRRYDDAMASARDGGARLVKFELRHQKEAIACRSLIVHAEAASYHRRYFAERYSEYGSDLRQRLSQGRAIPATVYLDALRARGPIIDEYRSIFSRVEVIALPTTRISAPTISACKSPETAAEIRTELLAFTEPFNVYGAPAISIPCGLTEDGLPVGLQLAGDLFADQQLLSAALSVERLLPRILEGSPLRN